MKTILSTFLALTLLLGAALIATTSTGVAATKDGKSSTKKGHSKNRSGPQHNAGRKKTNIPKNPN
jgi:hypothetical protein